jgi:hypothetical protein
MTASSSLKKSRSYLLEPEEVARQTSPMISTGERGDRIRLDDPHVIKIESEDMMKKTVRFVRESMSNRINDDSSAIVIIMQRLHEDDVSGNIIPERRARERVHLRISSFEPRIFCTITGGHFRARFLRLPKKSPLRAGFSTGPAALSRPPNGCVDSSRG